MSDYPQKTASAGGQGLTPAVYVSSSAAHSAQSPPGNIYPPQPSYTGSMAPPQQAYPSFPPQAQAYGGNPQTGQQYAQANAPVPMAMPVGTAMVSNFGAMQNQVTEANMEKIGSLVTSIRKISIVILVMGIVGLIPTFVETSNILAIAAGWVALAGIRNKEDILFLGRNGRVGPAAAGPAPIHAYNICIAILVFSSVSVLYTIPLAVVMSHQAFGPPPDCQGNTHYNDPDCNANPGGLRYLAVAWILGTIWCIAYIVFCSWFIVLFNMLATAVGPGLRYGTCCTDGAIQPNMQAPMYIIAPANGGIATTQTYIQPQQAYTIQPQQGQGQPQQQQQVYMMQGQPPQGYAVQGQPMQQGYPMQGQPQVYVMRQ
jgi:hypothetical protein